ncbi:hypothetical protein ASD11_15000 [Aeromicrobium sp. Root495]|uniref:hypothetical protein n=1 Tax=Aeromicrobium sp. Root495 TaxID=1736550 RepID=UPI0006F9FFB6|nr:hypothetical protein [Aeromicrobium sp. Root495]KQY55809.1 hypothetical protein ASD11_15000 [Aeromicrobium sp. Root495]
MTLFIVTASIFDNTSPADDDVRPDEVGARAWSLAVLRVTALTEGLILILGYKVGADLAEPHGPSLGWWVGHALCLFVPVAFVLALRRFETLLAVLCWFSSGVRAVMRPTGLVLAVAAAPTVATLAVVSFAGLETVPLTLFSVLSALYFGLVSAFLLLMIEVRSSRT